MKETKEAGFQLDEEVIEKEAYAFYRIFEELHTKLNWSQNIYLNRDLLRITVESYLHDLQRYREYHGSEIADKHKRAAFTFTWISKIKPINIRSNDTPLSAMEVLSNSIYASIAALGQIDGININKISNHYFDHLLYISYYRNPDGMQLASSFYLLEKALKKEYP